MDKLSAMRSFIQVVEAGSFSRAAELLALPKSTVTRQLQALENDVGSKLLHRTSRRLSLTTAGEAYYQGALSVLEQLARLDSRVVADGATPGGLIRVEMAGALAYGRILPALPDFLSRYPELQLELSVGNRTIDLIEQRIDCVIRVGPLRNDALIARSLGALEMVVCAAPCYLARNGTPQHPAQLARDHHIVQVASPQSGRAFQHTLTRDGEEIALQGRWQLSVNDATAALSAACAGAGVVTTYRFLADEALASGKLVALLPQWRLAPVPVHIAWPENRHLASRVRLFIDWVRLLFSAEAPQ
ncbi:LysR family transcriptional regulator [Izhakiella australiensis]|uniref:LysR family transcriptional regulator n=1 Tax=Izhakiella australiensis TaxID=1926881 RepID=A0A1S8YT34_9GAMM|nr:LysR family transcriptional regulator [Izhakiella australiensis]OON42008.1 LysR family transcriptional regulator [Izhakiella australiensis]